MPSIPNDKDLYEKTKKDIYKKYPTHSAYRSGLLTKAYKEAYLKKHKSNNAYSGKKNENEGLSAWFKQEWKTQDGKTSYQKKGDIFRPTKIAGKTPTLLQELSKKQIETAMREK